MKIATISIERRSNMLGSFFDRLYNSAYGAERFGIVLSIITYTVLGGVILGIFSLWLIPVGLIIGFIFGIHKNRRRLLKFPKK